jgi:hypothetical protein
MVPRDLAEGTLELKIFSDADFGGDRLMRKSHDGGAVVLVGKYGTRAYLTGDSSKQPATASSTGEAEVGAASRNARRYLPILMLIEHILGKSIPVVFLVDATTVVSCVKMGYSGKMRYVRKHQGVSISFLHDAVGDIIQYVTSEANFADIFTKGLPPDSHNHHCNFGGLERFGVQGTAVCKCFCKGSAASAFGKDARCMRRAVDGYDGKCVECSGSEVCKCSCWGGHLRVEKTKLDDKVENTQRGDTVNKTDKNESVKVTVEIKVTSQGAQRSGRDANKDGDQREEDNDDIDELTSKLASLYLNRCKALVRGGKRQCKLQALYDSDGVRTTVPARQKWCRHHRLGQRYGVVSI